tara:strand:- start:225 stop:923 length:699 start_codon:yes stop_codon:yes gene_type:complete
MIKGSRDRELLLSQKENQNNLISPDIEYPLLKHKINLGILASGNGTNFESIVNCSKSKILNANIKLIIVNNKDCGAAKKASKFGIKCIYLDHRDFSSRLQYDNEIVKYFSKENVEAIAMAGWMRIVTTNLINHYPERIINIHPSLLPSFKGINAIDQALKAGVRITGCTAHIVENEVDSGKIICQAAVEITDDDNADSLRKKIQINEHKILPLAIAIAAQNWSNIPKDKMDK